MTLEQIAEELQQKIAMLESAGEADYSEYLACYTALTHVRQAMALERIANNLDTFRINGLLIENVDGR